MKRFFHLQGMTSLVKLEVPENTTFTGIFSGAEHGILRWSPLAPLLKERFLVNHFIGTFFFSFGLKFFRDGIHSANLLTGDTNKGWMAYTNSRSFYDKPDFNIFSRPLDNMPGIADNAPLFGEFELISGVISTSDAAAYSASGEEVVDVKAPVIVHFAPNKELAKTFGRVGKQVDFRKWTVNDDSLKAGVVLYKVYTTITTATGEPSLCTDDTGNPVVDDASIATTCPDQSVVLVGNVVMKDKFRISKWGDEKIFFQHTRVCPKDQQLCQSTADGLQQPIPWYAEDKEKICCSSDDTTGNITGELPECPNQGMPISDYCYPGNERQVEKVQSSHCPLMKMLTPDIFGIDGEPNSSSRCGFFSRNFVSFSIRGFLWPFHLFHH